MPWAFVPIAVLVTLTPGPSTAMIVRSALRGGWRCGVLTVLANEVGVLAWALLSALGVSALVAASEVAFVTLKIGGAALLVLFGLQALLRKSQGVEVAPEPAPAAAGWAFRDGLVTSLANPKLAVFFVSLLPQFVPRGQGTLAAALEMALLIVVFDLVWYVSLALAIDRVRRAVVGSRLARRIQQSTGVVLVGLGARLALAHR
jgi:threonine/homoserine/homoserine lactone efflux protein